MSTPTPDEDIAAAAAAVAAAIDAIGDPQITDGEGLGAVTRDVMRLSRRQRVALDSVRDLAGVVVRGVQASEADRTMLHTGVDTAMAEADAAAAAATSAAAAAGSASTAAASAATAAEQRAASASSAATAASSASTAASRAAQSASEASAAAQRAVDALGAARPRTAPSVPVPAMLTVAGSTSVDVKLTWTTPWPAAVGTAYEVQLILEPTAGLLGKVGAVVKSRTEADVVATVTTTAVLASGTTTLRAIAVAR